MPPLALLALLAPLAPLVWWLATSMDGDHRDPSRLNAIFAHSKALGPLEAYRCSVSVGDRTMMGGGRRGGGPLWVLLPVALVAFVTLAAFVTLVAFIAFIALVASLTYKGQGNRLVTVPAEPNVAT